MEECGRKRHRLNDDDGQDDDPEISHGHRFRSTQAYAHSSVHQGDIYNSVVHNHGSQPDVSSSGLPSGVKTSEVLFLSLAYDRQDARLHNIQNAMPRTCRWLLNHKLFQSWTSEDWSEHNGFLWIKGKPGCGKSTLVKTALQHITALSKKQGNPHIILSYFFNARAPSSLEKSALGFYRSVIHSLLAAIPALKDPLERDFAWKVRGDSVDSWTTAELCNFLHTVFAGEQTETQTVYIFVDALDEGDLSDVQVLVSQLDDLASHATDQSIKLRICLSSRHFPEVVYNRGLELTVEREDAHEEDIKHYITKKLPGNSVKLKELRAEVQKRSDHVFLWVVLVVSILNDLAAKGRNLHQMQERLQQIPPDLDGLFSEILRRDLDGIDECGILLQWVAFAFQSLAPTELYHAITCASSDGHFPPELPEPGDLERFIRHTSRGLAEITRTKHPSVQFIHETVRSFLLSRGLSMLDVTLAPNAEAQCHDRMSEACSQYLRRVGAECAAEESAYQKAISEYTFISYAIKYTYLHSEKAAENGFSQSQRLKRLQNGDGLWQDESFRKWRDAGQPFKVRKYGDRKLPLIYLLAEQNLPTLANECLALGCNVNAPGGRYGYPLQAACINGNAELVDVLLGQGADVDKQGGEYMHSWAAAVLTKNFGIAAVLRGYGAKPSRECLQKTLLKAVARRSLLGVQAVIDTGKGLDAVNASGNSALAMAIYEGLLDIVELLLKSSRDINASGALTAAALTFEPELLGRIMKQCNWNESDLHCALIEVVASGLDLSEMKAMTLMLLAHGAKPDVSRRARHSWSALHLASSKTDATILNLLLEADVNVDARGEFSETPLMQAAGAQSLDCVHALLNAGADFNLVSDLGATTLHGCLYSSTPASIDMVQTLLNHNPIITHQDYRGFNSLAWAIKNGRRHSEGIPRLILNHAILVGDTEGLLSNQMLEEALVLEDKVLMASLLDLAQMAANMMEGASPYWVDILRLRRKLALVPSRQRDDDLHKDLRGMLDRSSDPEALMEDLSLCGISMNINWSHMTAERSTANRSRLCWTDILHPNP